MTIHQDRPMTPRKLLLAAAVAATALLVPPVTPASAHETGAIHVSAHEVAVGGSIGVRGEKLPKASDLKLELRGVLDNYPVGSVKTDTAGAFQLEVTLPQNVPAGAYTLVVIASDGDVTARADVAVAAAASPATTQPGGMGAMPGMASTGPGTEERATAAEMPITHATTPIGWAVIWGLIVLSLGSGAALLRRAATLG
jgi:hypothetical protein